MNQCRESVERNATAQTPEKATPGEKRGRGQEWLRQGTAKKDRRPNGKRLQEQWRGDIMVLG